MIMMIITVLAERKKFMLTLHTSHSMLTYRYIYIYTSIQCIKHVNVNTGKWWHIKSITATLSNSPCRRLRLRRRWNMIYSTNFNKFFTSFSLARTHTHTYPAFYILTPSIGIFFLFNKWKAAKLRNYMPSSIVPMAAAKTNRKTDVLVSTQPFHAKLPTGHTYTHMHSMYSIIVNCEHRIAHTNSKLGYIHRDYLFGVRTWNWIHSNFESVGKPLNWKFCRESRK